MPLKCHKRNCANRCLIFSTLSSPQCIPATLQKSISIHTSVSVHPSLSIISLSATFAEVSFLCTQRGRKKSPQFSSTVSQDQTLLSSSSSLLLFLTPSLSAETQWKMTHVWFSGGDRGVCWWAAPCLSWNTNNIGVHPGKIKHTFAVEGLCWCLFCLNVIVRVCERLIKDSCSVREKSHTTCKSASLICCSCSLFITF